MRATDSGRRPAKRRRADDAAFRRAMSRDGAIEAACQAIVAERGGARALYSVLGLTTCAVPEKV